MEDYDYSNSEVALLVNGLGSTPLMELYVLNNDVRNLLKEKSITVKENLVGNYMTAFRYVWMFCYFIKTRFRIRKFVKR